MVSRPPPRTTPSLPLRPARRRVNRGPGILWGVLGAAVAGLMVGGLFWLDSGTDGPGPGSNQFGHLSPPAAEAPAAPIAPEPPAPILAPILPSLLPPESAALLPDSAPAPMAVPAPAAVPAPTPAAPATLAPSAPAPVDTVPAPAPASVAALPRATLDEIAVRIPTRLTAYRAAHNPRVLILDFPSFRAQAVALNRVAALIEKKGAPRDRVMSDGELRQMIAAAGQKFDTYYGGHDYDSAALARFFTLAEAIGVTVPEGEVLEILLKQRVIRVADKGFVAGDPVQSVISLAATGAERQANVALRRDILRHEMAHGEFFTQVFYRAACDRFWRENLSAAERKLFIKFLDKAGYDTTNETLVINEMQAYVGFTPSPDLFGGRQLGSTDDAVTGLRGRFRAAVPPPPDF